MVVTLGFYPGDRDQAVRLAEWMNELGSYTNHELYILRDARCEPIPELGSTFGKRNEIIAHAQIDGWPGGANYFFRTITSHLSYRPEVKYFLWLEPDAIPLKEGWLDAIEQEYLKCGKKFMGDDVDVNDVPRHLSGIAVYPNPLHAYAGEAYRAADTAWDVAGAAQIVPQAHFTELIVHNWKHEAFQNQGELDNLRSNHPEMVLFHSDKTMSLVKLIKDENKNLHQVQSRTTDGSVSYDTNQRFVVEAVSDLHEQDSKRVVSQDREMGQSTKMGSTKGSMESSSPSDQSRKNKETDNLPTMRDRHSTTRSSQRLQQTIGSNVAVSTVSRTTTRTDSQTTDIFIRTYPKDYPWLSYCLESVRKYCSGFRKTWVVSPEKPVFLPPDVEWKVLNEETEDGYLAQQIHKLYADVITDYGADYILFTDSDTLFTQPVTPETFFKNGKIVWYYTPYDHTDTPWKPITEKFMGREVKYEFMRRHPFMIPRWLLPKFREFCHFTHGMILSDYIRNQPDRSFSEFNALGAFAYEKYRDKFEWVNTVEENPPPPVVRQFFSWNGLTPEVESEIRTILGNGTACVSVTIPDPTSAIENTETPVPPQANAGDHIRWLKEYVAEKPTRRQYVLLQLKKAGLQPKWKRKS